jgi:TATA-box binding protein (TBP) (component of TFIID and TFIIIB)
MSKKIKILTPRISTMTCDNRIYREYWRPNTINIYKLAMILKCDVNIRYIRYADKVDVMDYSISESKYIYGHGVIYCNPWYNCKDIDPREAYRNPYTTTDDFIKYIYDGKYFSIIIEKGIKYKRIRKKKKSQDTKKFKRLDFKNSMTIEINIDDYRSANNKIHKNGKMETVGCYEIEQNDRILKILGNKFIEIQKEISLKIKNKVDELLKSNFPVADHYIKFYGNENLARKKVIEDVTESFNKKYKIFSGTIEPKLCKISMRMCHTTISPDEFIQLDLQKMYDFVINNKEKMKNVYPTYKNSKNKILRLDLTCDSGIITLMIFRSGKINMTGICSRDQITISHEFLEKFLNDNIDEFKLYNQDMSILEKIEKSIKQRTKEWLNARLKCITASEVSKIILRKFYYGSYLKYMDIKSQQIRNGVDHLKFVPNKYMLFGTFMEPIAQKIVEAHYNNDPAKYKFRCKILNTGLIVSEKTPEIAASPDGVLIKYDMNVPKIKSDDISVLRKNFNVIRDICLVEIKCPSKNYVRINHPDEIKKLKPSYYWQMQQQMYVCDIKYCIFAQFKFNYFSRKRFIDEKIFTVKGLYGVVGEKAFYPVEIIFQYNDDIKKLKDIEGKLLKMDENIEIKYWYLEEYNLSELEYNAQDYESQLKDILKTFEKIKRKKGTIEDPSG